jgi:cysteine desulfuration protein SufE
MGSPLIVGGTPEERKKGIEKEWSGIASWEDRYKKLIELGKKMPPLPEEFRTEDNKVRGCQSQVWIRTEKKEGRLFYAGDSDALIVRGLVALVLGIYSNSTPEEILKTPPDFVKNLGFETHLSPSRTNGLYSMIKRVITDAVLYKNDCSFS